MTLRGRQGREGEERDRKGRDGKREGGSGRGKRVGKCEGGLNLAICPGAHEFLVSYATDLNHRKLYMS